MPQAVLGNLYFVVNYYLLYRQGASPSLMIVSELAVTETEAKLGIGTKRH